MPAFLVAGSQGHAGASAIRDGVNDGTFIEFDVGDEQGRCLVVVTKTAPATRRGRWFEGVLLASTYADWRAWYDNHGPSDAERGGSSGLFHLCTKRACTASSTRKDLPEVHAEAFRVLTHAQAGKLVYAREGLAASDVAVDSTVLSSGDSGDEAMALGALGSTGRRGRQQQMQRHWGSQVDLRFEVTSHLCHLQRQPLALPSVARQ